MIAIRFQQRIRVSALLFLAVTLGLGTVAFANPHFLIDSHEQWLVAMDSGKIMPLSSGEWGRYMSQWSDPESREGPPYPNNIFSQADLFVYPGGGDGGLDPKDAGLVMVWGPQEPIPPGSYSSAWKYDYQLDPDLSNSTITVTITPPQWGGSGQINVVSFGIQDIGGNIRAWYWNCGPGNPIPWNVPTTVTINTALTGVGAATPTANSYVNNPGFNLVNSMSFIVDENVQWIGGPVTVPPPGTTVPRLWNYWHDVVVTPNIPPKGTNPTKWSQPVVEVSPATTPPIFNGWDEKSLYYQPPIVADDWECRDNRPVTDIHWWGSFVGWDQPYPPQLPQAFHIAIWSDVPKDPSNPNSYSHPDKIVWETRCTNFRWNFAGYDRDPRINADGTPFTVNEACFQFNQDLLPSEYFYQDAGPTGRRVYWLSIAALTTATDFPWGWKTRPHYYNDDAVRIQQANPWPLTVGSVWMGGEPIEYPTGTSWDLAFELTTHQKWSQEPDLSTTGIDVKATKPLILADDFQCTKQTKITDISVWGSWLNDQLPKDAAGQPDAGQVAFTLSLHSDIPAGSQGYSRPGDLLWIKTFQPGQFTVSQYATNLKEGWWDPSIPTSYNPNGDTICWKYDFDIPAAEAFCQQGSTANPKVYWLDVQAEPQGTATSGCILPDNGSGTADLPPVGCAYLTPNDDMRIVDGLPVGDTVEIDATHTNFVCLDPNNVCSFPPGTNCRQPGGSLLGEKECFSSQLLMPMVGTGSLAGFNRNIVMPVNFEVHTAPRTLGDPVQSFDTDMFRLFGQITGDPDFDLLRLTAGTDFGMPSPGHTTLTQQPGGNWAVDSFFDITYRIDFVGAPGGPLGGKSGSTTATIRFQIPGGGATDAQFGWKTSLQHWNDDAVCGAGCYAPDTGLGTATLPPPCSYDDVDGGFRIVDGLSPGDTIKINTELGEYSNQFEVPGGNLGGSKQTYDAMMPFDMTGTGGLAGFTRQVSMPIAVETHSAPRTPHDPVQSFDTDMFRLQGQLPPGDPDFDLLRITAGTGFGMPSPGHTTLTSIYSGNWAVDSFFDITYRIDFVGAPGGPLSGMSGSTTMTARVQVGPWNELRYPPNHPMMDQSMDLAFVIDGNQPCDEMLDFGDAPDPTYPTLLASDGARHSPSGIFMGPAIDYEADGQPTVGANGDDLNGTTPDDEDGVVFNTGLSPGMPTTVTVTASVGGTYLSTWVDFNGDGSWATPGDQIFVAQPMVAGPNVLTFLVPASATTHIKTYARFRLHTDAAGVPYTGYQPNGEVEDYLVKIYKKVTKAGAKRLPLGSYVLIDKDVVTANFGSVGWYFEEPDRPGQPATSGRFAGIGVHRMNGAAPWNIGDTVSCCGETFLNGCELMVMEDDSWLETGMPLIAPLAENNRDSGGSLFGNQPGLIDVVALAPALDKPAAGLNNVATLITLTGRCTCIEVIGGVQTNFWINDGSDLWDGNTCGATAPARGVKVRIPTGYAGRPISTQDYYAVTGIMRTYNSPAEGECVRWLWPRMDSDIRTFSP